MYHYQTTSSLSLENPCTPKISYPSSPTHTIHRKSTTSTSSRKYHQSILTRSTKPPNAGTASGSSRSAFLNPRLIRVSPLGDWPQFAGRARVAIMLSPRPSRFSRVRVVPPAGALRKSRGPRAIGLSACARAYCFQRRPRGIRGGGPAPRDSGIFYAELRGDGNLRDAIAGLGWFGQLFIT